MLGQRGDHRRGNAEGSEGDAGRGIVGVLGPPAAPAPGSIRPIDGQNCQGIVLLTWVAALSRAATSVATSSLTERRTTGVPLWLRLTMYRVTPTLPHPSVMIVGVASRTGVRQFCR